MANHQPTRDELLILGGSAATFVLSFFTWFGDGSSAWDGGFLSLGSLLALVSLTVAALIGRRFTTVELPERVVGFTERQLIAALAAWPFLIAWCVPITNSDGLTGAFWLALCGANAAVVGAALELRTAPSTSSPPTSF